MAVAVVAVVGTEVVSMFGGVAVAGVWRYEAVTVVAPGGDGVFAGVVPIAVVVTFPTRCGLNVLCDLLVGTLLDWSAN